MSLRHLDHRPGLSREKDHLRVRNYLQRMLPGKNEIYPRLLNVGMGYLSVASGRPLQTPAWASERQTVLARCMMVLLVSTRKTWRMSQVLTSPPCRCTAWVDSRMLTTHSQFFPDQNTYGPLTTSGTSNFSQVVESGVDWIKQHAQTANTSALLHMRVLPSLTLSLRYGRPSALNSFGLATNSSSNTFAPFNSSGQLLFYYTSDSL